MIFDYIPPADVVVATSFAVGLCVLALVALSWVHGRNLRRVPLRIHVGGSRGKTSTVRYLAAALREGGFTVLAKTTGTLPLLIMPDGREVRWSRWGAPSVAETARFFRLARHLKVDAVVLESMAIEPEYLWAAENYLVRATHLVLTNARPDHAEVLGTDDDAMARALSLLVPRQGHVFLTDESNLAPILAASRDNASSVSVVESAGASPDRINRALAQSVCTSLGLAPEVISAGFDRAKIDPGGFFVRDIVVDDRPLRFHNAFACNDVLSLERLWQDHPAEEMPIVLLNARFDRPERTKAFLDFLATLPPVKLVIAGAWRPAWARQAGLAPENIARLRSRDPAGILRELAALAPSRSVWGVGNYAGVGETLSDYLREQGSLLC